MEPEVKAVFFFVAVVLFVIEGIRAKYSLVAFGLAAFVFPFAWDELDAA